MYTIWQKCAQGLARVVHYKPVSANSRRTSWSAHYASRAGETARNTKAPARLPPARPLLAPTPARTRTPRRTHEPSRVAAHSNCTCMCCLVPCPFHIDDFHCPLMLLMYHKNTCRDFGAESLQSVANEHEAHAYGDERASNLPSSILLHVFFNKSEAITTSSAVTVCSTCCCLPSPMPRSITLLGSSLKTCQYPKMYSCS